jgi:hypothetical protein
MSNEELVNNKPKHKKILNTSGQGKNAIVPKSVANRFNWGAFGFGWIWGIFNKTWITLILLAINLVVNSVFSTIIPQEQLKTNPSLLLQVLPFCLIFLVVSFAIQIWFGIKGNTWAWQNKRWRNIEHFHKIQKRWAIVYGILCLIPFIIIIIGVILAFVVPVLMAVR